MTEQLTTPPLNEQIGQQAKTLRKLAGLSLRALEEQSGIPAPQLSSMERGARNWLPHHLEAVARALGVHPRQLIPFKDEPTANTGPATVAPEVEQIAQIATMRVMAAHHSRELRRLADDLDRLAGDVEGG